MATWRIRLRTGTFRGAPFQYDTQELEGGRQVQTLGIPTSDLHVSEDLGRAPKRVTVTAYVVGDLVTLQRDALIAALDQKGPGTLSLALWPGRQMHVPTYRVRESKKQLGYCEIEIEFVEASRKAQPAAGADTGATLLGSATGLAGAAQAAFAQGWSVAGLASGIAEAAFGQVLVVADALGGLIPLGATSLNAANFADAVGLLASTPAVLVASPTALGGAIANVFGAYCAAECERDRAEEVLGTLGAFTVPAPTEQASAVGAGEAANAVALTRLVRQAALVERARVARVVPLASRDEARALEEALAADMTVEALAVADGASATANAEMSDAVFRSLNALKSAVVAHLEARAASLEPLVAYRSNGPVSDLALAYALYGTIGPGGARADELAARNAAIHPGFLPEAGSALAA